MPDYAAARSNMVESQIRPNKVTDPRILDAMLNLPRESFVPAVARGFAYVDEDIPLAKGRHLTEPMVVGRLLQESDVQSQDAVLVVGAGTGYSAAVLSRLANVVVALESDPEMAARAQELMSELGIDNVVVATGPLADGYAAQAPYNVVLIDGAVTAIPETIQNQLSDGGRLAAVLRATPQVGQGVIVQRFGQTFSQRPLFDAQTPILPGFERKPSFEF